MCMFCAAIPATAAVGTRLKAMQIQRRHRAESDGRALPQAKPITQLTVAAALVLLIGSVTYHTLAYQP